MKKTLVLLCKTGTFYEKCKFCLVKLINLMVWNTHSLPPDPPDPVSSTAARDPPTTRAGGQDDGN